MTSKAPNVINFYDKIKITNTYINPNKYTPQHPHRTIIVGASGSMKTNTLMNIIQASKAYTKIYLFAKALDEPLYDYLQVKLAKLKDLNGASVLVTSSALDDLQDVEDFNPCEQNLVIFDDMISEGAKKIKDKLSDLFIRGRKQNISTIFISQSFYEIPKIIRGQANYYILKNITSKADRNLIIRDIGLDKEEMMAMFDRVIKADEKTFFMVDKKTTKSNMRYRINFEPMRE